MIKGKTLFSKKDLKDWIPYYKGAKGERIVDAMDKNNVNYSDFYNFYQKYGDMQLEFIEKITTERLRSEEFSNMTPVQAAFLGYDIMLSFMKQLSVEIYAIEQEKKK